jgi:hypothetical protein
MRKTSGLAVGVDRCRLSFVVEIKYSIEAPRGTTTSAVGSVVHILNNSLLKILTIGVIDEYAN